ncbi:MAG: divergent PAP2 family protein [Oscillospiraceae bacterium]|jgi:hypothetical protein|nr:divergent PAP2 family protein [Oscillospiraceae bacterium]
MGSLRILFSNYLINVGFVAWFSAQLIKTLLVLISTKKFEAERLFGAGGMPSSHSALACSMAIGMCRKMGFDSPEFALALAFAAVVMYDAMGVRRAAGEQAKVLNKMVFDFSDLWGKPDREKKPPQGDGEENEKSILGDKALKEYLGHTPLEVLGGALLGILVAMMIKVT